MHAALGVDALLLADVVLRLLVASAPHQSGKFLPSNFGISLITY